MGVLDKLGEILKGKPNKENAQKSKYIYTKPIQNSKEEIMAFNIDVINSVKHRDNEITDIIMARLTKHNPMETIYMDLADYVAFEVPKGTEINDEIMNLVMEQYEKETLTKSQEQQYYFGRLTNNRGINELGNKSATVENLVKQTVQRILKQKETQQEQKKIEEEQKKQEEISKREEFLKSIDGRKYIESMQNEKNNRKLAPTLQKKYVPEYEQKGQKTYSNYDGINVNTGDILRIRQVDKIGKDGSGTYLYSAYIDNIANDYDVEIFDEEPMGIPVCFELPKSLENIINSGDVNEINKVLQLLSVENINPNQLNYIGEIDKNGKIERNSQSSSPAIQKHIAKMKKDFSDKLAEQGR